MTDSLNNKEVNLISKLLMQSTLCDNESKRYALLIQIGASDLDVDVSMAPREFAVILVDKLNRTGHTQILNNLATLIMASIGSNNIERDQIDTILTGLNEKTQFRKSPQHIHLVTSVKGGVGKTLVALSVAANYYLGKRGKELLALDINTMNPDLFRILAAFSGPKPHDLAFDVSHIPNWRYAFINRHLQIIRPNDPYILPYGTEEIWKQIAEVLKLLQKGNSFNDILIDTNVHIANLFRGDENTSSIIESILTVPDRKIFFWVFWTWAAIQDSDPITTTIRFLKQNFQDKIEVIHVLNPSALMPPQINFPSMLKLMDAVKSAVDLATNLSKFFPNPPNNLQAAMDLLQETYLETVTRDINQDTQYGLYDIPGLKDLAQANVVNAITSNKFRDILRQFFNNLSSEIPVEHTFEELYKIMVEDDGVRGRPINVFPISTHNPELIGYTEYFARSQSHNIADLLSMLTTIESNLDSYLGYLDPLNVKL